ncbi:Growth hormone secretagogue receptor type 1 [Takifugu flavidus]|uniref:Growth hormone secretagogue receptor type 1 n=2 Tax=Takifugu flavidus TaxID=433684 RepID=A0A5C6NPI9_9TELE|nr:Growth hormone secretagogue receptor type 1 [Takifugu flavidus]
MFFSECCTFCSILHITFISLERYLAVCWPFTAKTLVTRRRTRTIIGCIWLGAAISAAPVLVMVGVEEVGSEDQGLTGWRENGAWTGKEGEKGFIIGAREREITDLVLKDEELDVINLKDKEINECSKSDAVTKGFNRGDETLEVGERNKKEEEHEDGAVEEEGPVKGEGKRTQNKMKEDEGGGREDMDGGDRMQMDVRECRCTDYAVSSGLLSAMLVLSNMYFLVPVCILGLVYSLIGRTLWLRSHNSRRDLNNRHTVKMLGVIVLVFVLCWLPFHVGRTIFFFTLGSDRHTGNTSHVLGDSGPDGFVNFDYALSDHPSETGSSVVQALGEDDETTRDVVAEAQLNTHADGDTSFSIPENETHTDPAEQCDEAGNANTQPVTPVNLATTENDTTFNNTHSDSQYFLYYLSQYFNLVSSVLFYLSAAINPLLYNLMSERYRHAVHSLMRKHTRTPTYRLQTLDVPHSTTTV